MNKITARLLVGFSLSMLALGPSLIVAEPAPTAPAAPAAPEASTGGGPKIQFENSVYDFGKVKSGDPVKHTYIFTNTGTELLIITNVQPGCGCTAAGEWSRQVEPGKTGSIPIQFNSANYNGMVMKNVTVTCNDKSQPTVMLQIKGTIWKPIEVNPQFAAVNVPAESKDPVKTVVKIVNNMEEPLHVFSPESNSKAFTAELQTNVVGKEFQVNISTVPPLDPGNAQGTITLKTSSSNSPVLNVTAWANVQAAVSVNPGQVMLPGGPLANRQSATVSIQNNGPNALTLSEPSVNAKGVDVQINEPQPGRLFTANLSFPEGFEAQGTSVKFTVKTSHPNYPFLTVPIIQVPRPAASTQPTIVPLTPAAPSSAPTTTITPPPAPGAAAAK